MKTFKSKTEVIMYLKKNILSKIYVSGSTALKLYGLSDDNAFDIDICMPEYGVSDIRFLKNLRDLFPVDNNIDIEYEPTEDSDVLGRIIQFKLPSTLREPFKIDFFIDCKGRTGFMYESHGEKFLIDSPADIIEAKKIMSRSKDWRQLATMCSKLMS